MLDSLSAQSATESATVLTLIYVVLVAFVLSSVVAWIYQITFLGLSFSRNYVQSIILISIISAIIIQSVGDSLARGIGIMAAMAIIRFRTNFKDPRDTLFLFAGLAVGISTGAYAFTVAMVGTAGFSLAAVILHYSPIGPDAYFDAMLRFTMQTDSGERSEMETIMHDYCRTFSLITLREIDQGAHIDYAYHVKLRRGKSHADLLQALSALNSVNGVNVMMQEATVEI